MKMGIIIFANPPKTASLGIFLMKNLELSFLRAKVKTRRTYEKYYSEL